MNDLKPWERTYKGYTKSQAEPWLRYQNQDREIYVDDDSGRTINAPASMTMDRAIYEDKIRNQGRKDEGFLGYVDTGLDYISALTTFEPEARSPLILSRGALSRIRGGADFLSTLYKAPIATITSLTTKQIAEPGYQIADSVREGLEYNIDDLYERQAAGERLTAEESDVLRKDIARRSNPFGFLFESLGDKLRQDAMEAVSSGDDLEAQRLTEIADKTEASADLLLKKTNDFLKEYNLTRPPEEESTIAERLFYDIISGATSFAVALGATIATKNTSSAALLFANAARSDAYIEAREAGTLSVDNMNLLANIRGVTEGSLEAIGLGAIMKVFKSNRVMKRVFGGALTEFVQETLQSGAESATMQVSGVRDVDVEGAVIDALYNGLIGFIIGGSAGSLQLINQVAEERKIDINAEKITRVIEEKRPEIIDAISEVVVQETTKTPDKKAQKKVFDILTKFSKGEEIDVIAELEATNELNQEQKNEIITSFKAKQEKMRLEREEVIRKGRLRKLDNDISKIDKEIDTLELQLKDAKEKGGATKNLENKIDKLFEQREELDLQRGDLLTAADTVVFEDESGIAVTDEDIVTQAATQEEIIIKGKRLQQLGIKADNNAINGIKTAIRSATNIAKNDAKAAQSMVVDAIKNSPLSQKDKGKFLDTIKNIRTTEQAIKAFPRINARINRLLEKQQKRELKSAIKKVLKTTKVKALKSRPIGRFGTAEIQETLDILRDAAFTTKDAAQERLEYNLSQPPDPITALENRILQIVADINSAPVSDMANTLAEIVNLKETGRLIQGQKDLERKAAIKQESADLTDAVLDGKDVEDLVAVDFKEKMGAAWRGFLSVESWLTNNWFDHLDLIFGKTDEGRKLRDKYAGMVHRSLENVKRMQIEYGNEFAKSAKRIYGISKRSKLQGKFLNDERVEKIKDANGRVLMFERTNGKVMPWKISRAQARKLYMELKDPYAREALVAPEGNAISESMENYLVEVFLTPEDIMFAEAQLEIYDKLYDPINDTYSKIYGVNLPRNDNYSPIRREHDQELAIADPFLEEIRMRIGSLPGFTRTRTDNTLPLELQSDVVVMTRHIGQASHFVSMAETTRDLRSVFSDRNLRKAVKAKFGGLALDATDGYVQDFTVGHIQRVEAGMKWIEVLNANFAKSVLGLNPNLLAKQMVSFVAYAADIPAKDFAIGLADFAKNPKKAIEILSSTAYMKSRASSEDVALLEKAIADSKRMQGILGRLAVGKAKFDDVSLLLLKLGDRGAIYLGGWSVYKYHKDVLGKSHEEALDEFVKVTDMTQQSSALDQLSRFQAQRNPIGRTFSMFMTAPLAYYRAQKRAIRQRYRGEIGNAEFSKKMFIFNIWLPVMFQWVSDAFSWGDDEDKSVLARTTGIEILPTSMERALITGPIDGLLIVGPLLDNSFAYAQGINFPDRTFQFMQGPKETLEKSIDYIKTGEKVDFIDVIEALGYVFGLPAKTVINEAEGVKQVLENDLAVGARRAVGFSKKTAERAAGKTGENMINLGKSKPFSGQN